ncbi:MAG: tRNA-dihydrouridine synthase, partial [Planctomycetota bacterium]
QDWEPIAELARRLTVPVVGSGDVVDASGFARRRALGVGVMIARGALGRPWVFSEVLGDRPPAWPEAAATLLRHARLQADWYGEARGIRGLRGHLARYLQGYREAAGLRPLLVRADTVREVEAALAPTLESDATEAAEKALPQRAIMPRSPAVAGGGGPLA